MWKVRVNEPAWNRGARGRTIAVQLYRETPIVDRRTNRKKEQVGGQSLLPAGASKAQIEWAVHYWTAEARMRNEGRPQELFS